MIDIPIDKNLCESCMNARIIVSENGYKAICTLSNQKMYNCVIGRDDHYKKKPDWMKDGANK